MKIFKRTLSLVLAVLMLASISVIIASAAVKTAPRTGEITYFQRNDDGNVVDADGNPVPEGQEEAKGQKLTVTQKYGTKPVVTEVVNGEEDIQCTLKTYRFYMPDNWKNDRNDNYDGNNLDSCAAGIYWWGTAYNCEDYKNGIVDAEGHAEYENAKGWFGYRILEQDPNDPHVFICSIPEETGMIIFNNLVDGGQTPIDNPGYGYNYQTANIPTTYTSAGADEYGFYTTTKDGQEITSENPMTFDDMIFVVDPKNTEKNEFSGATTTKGEWFYYYGNGEYGTTPEKGEKVYKNGEFPKTLQIDSTRVVNYMNDEPVSEILCNMNPANVKVTVEDASIASVSAPVAVEGSEMWESMFTVTGLKEGKTTVSFVELDEQGNEHGKPRVCDVENTYIEPMVDASNKSVYIGKTVKLNADIMFAESVSYTSSNKKVATVDSKGVVKGIAAGTATITVTAKAGEYTVTAKAKVTVKKLANPMTVKASAKTVKYAKVKKKAQTVSAIKVSKAQGKVTYTKKSGKFAVNKKNGKITVKKGTKKGKYSVKVAVKAAGNAKYNASTKNVTVKITVK